jgi:hypothetical protein
MLTRWMDEHDGEHVRLISKSHKIARPHAACPGTEVNPPVLTWLGWTMSGLWPQQWLWRWRAEQALEVEGRDGNRAV